MMDLKDLLVLSVQKKASDLHLTENSPPILRIDGELRLTDRPALSRDDIRKMIYGILSDFQKSTFLTHDTVKSNLDENIKMYYF